MPGEFHGQRSLVGYSPWGCKESDMTERRSTHALKKKMEERKGEKEDRKKADRKKERKG